MPPVRIRTRQSLLLVMALLLGQWLAFAHDSLHPAIGADVHCQLCAHVQSLASGLPASNTQVSFVAFAHEAPQAAVALVTYASPRRACPIRGPPETQA